MVHFHGITARHVCIVVNYSFLVQTERSTLSCCYADLLNSMESNKTLFIINGMMHANTFCFLKDYKINNALVIVINLQINYIFALVMG